VAERFSGTKQKINSSRHQLSTCWRSFWAFGQIKVQLFPGGIRLWVYPFLGIWANESTTFSSGIVCGSIPFWAFGQVKVQLFPGGTGMWVYPFWAFGQVKVQLFPGGIRLLVQ
jgi:hypothetical protein